MHVRLRIWTVDSSYPCTQAPQKAATDARSLLTVKDENPIRNQFLNPLDNPFLAERRSNTAFEATSRIIPLISYPRSRNGWIRCLIAAYLISKLEKITANDMNRLSITQLREGAAGISVDNQNVYPIDLLVPNIYFFNNGSYAELEKIGSTSNCSAILSGLQMLPVKSHHAAHDFAAFSHLAFLVRKPEEAITSAGLLLGEDLNTQSAKDLLEYADSLSLAYQQFMEIIIAQLGSKPIIIIDTKNPYTGLLILFRLMGTDNVDLGLFSAVCSRFPVKSGYNKNSPLTEPVHTFISERNLNQYYEMLKV